MEIPSSCLKKILKKFYKNFKLIYLNSAKIIEYVPHSSGIIFVGVYNK